MTKARRRTGQVATTPGAGPMRTAIEAASARWLVRLAALPRWLAPAAMGVLLVIGLAVRGRGGAIPLLVLAGFLGWLLFLSWPRLPTGARLLRAVAVTVVAVAVGARLTG